MTDIVERLRKADQVTWYDGDGQYMDTRFFNVLTDAADEIERLREALEWFADKNNYIDCAVETEGYIRARTALQKDEG